MIEQGEEKRRVVLDVVIAIGEWPGEAEAGQS